MEGCGLLRVLAARQIAQKFLTILCKITKLYIQQNIQKTPHLFEGLAFCTNINFLAEIFQNLNVWKRLWYLTNLNQYKD